MIDINIMHTDGIHKQEIINLFNDCNIYPEEQVIIYYSDTGHWIGQYHLKNETFIYNWYYSSEKIKKNKLNFNKLLMSIIEEIIKRKVSYIV